MGVPPPWARTPKRGDTEGRRWVAIKEESMARVVAQLDLHRQQFAEEVWAWGHMQRDLNTACFPGDHPTDAR